jgi:Ca2+-binding RTX toxin-like protein
MKIKTLLARTGVAGVLTLQACGGPDAGTSSRPNYDGDLSNVDLEAGLTPLATPCSFASGTGIATLAMATGETAVVSRRAADSAILVNGTACGTATNATLKRLNVAEDGSGTVQTLILDFQNGTFAPGTATAAGINVDLGGGADALRIRTGSSADAISFGASGIGFNVDANKDITHANVESFAVSMAAGNDTFTGQGGNGSGTAFLTAVTVYGSDGNDTVTGGDGADFLYGGAGNDTLAGAAGADQLNGDDGVDTFNEGAVPNGGDVFNGGAGVDTVSYALRTAAVTVTLGAGATNDGEAAEADDAAADVEGVIGGTLADTLTGNPTLASVLTGGAGDDILVGGTGADTINGGAGADTITGGDGADVLNGDDGDDTFNEGAVSNGGDAIAGGAGVDHVTYTARTGDLVVDIDGTADDGEAGEADNIKTDVENVTGGAGADAITGSNAANALVGGAGDDTLSGGDGADTLTGGADDDILNGGAGDDVFAEGAAPSGGDQFNGGTGVDRVDYSLRTAVVFVTMDGAAADDGEGAEGDDVEADVENLDCGSGADLVTGNDLGNIINGAGGADVISGGAGADEIFGGAANDTLAGDAGDDLMDGGGGTNTLDCGAGDGDIGFNGTPHRLRTLRHNACRRLPLEHGSAPAAVPFLPSLLGGPGRRIFGAGS